MPIAIAPIALRHASGFHACLDVVAREKMFLAQIEALPLSRIEAFIQDNVANDAAQFVALERLRVQSLLQRDMPTAWRLHAPDYQLITPSGVSFSRERYLGMIEAGSLVYLQWQAEAMQVRQRGTMAVVRYPATLQLESGSAFRCWHTDTYEQTDGQWQAVWSQATTIRPD